MKTDNTLLDAINAEGIFHLNTWRVKNGCKLPNIYLSLGHVLIDYGREQSRDVRRATQSGGYVLRGENTTSYQNLCAECSPTPTDAYVCLADFKSKLTMHRVHSKNGGHGRLEAARKQAVSKYEVVYKIRQ